MNDDKIDKMLATNAEQKRYYEVASGARGSGVNSLSTNLWRSLRGRVFGSLPAGYQTSIAALHRQWIGDVSGLKVLELGVGNGSPLSQELAARAREYVAIDLSEARMEKLRKRLAAYPNARIYAADFLNDAFKESGFDVIYALAVFHHFEHFDNFLDVLEQKLAPGGRVITRDPVQMWLPIRIARAAYRPFQTDAEWEYPFTGKTIATIEQRFDVLERKGLLNRGKWAAVLGAVSPSLASRFAQRWHDADLRSHTRRTDLRKCLQVSYHLRKKATVAPKV